MDRKGVDQPITIIGAGAIGSYIYGQWSNEGLNTQLLGRPNHIEALMGKGLSLTGEGALHIEADSINGETNPACLSHSRAIILAVKSAAVLAAINEIKQFAIPGTPIISLLNGLSPVRTLRENLPEFPIIAGMVPFNCVWKNQFTLHRSSAGHLALENAPLSQEIAAVVAGSSVPIEIHNDLQQVQYGKLLLNLINPINALSGLPIRAQLSQRAFRSIYANVLREALDVYKAAGIGFVKSGPIAPAVAVKLLGLPNLIFNNTILKIQGVDATTRTSMAFDYEKERPTEIDALNGEIVQLAQQAGVPCPWNKAIVDIMRQEEAGDWKTYSGSELTLAITSQF